jgi:hypothetical protein
MTSRNWGEHAQSSNLLLLTLMSVLALAATATLAQTGDPGEKVLIRTAKPYDTLVADIQSRGGRVTYQYKYVDAIAAEVPRNVLASMRDKIGVGNITKDEIIPLPSSVDTLRGRNLTPSNAANEITADSFSALDAATATVRAGQGLLQPLSLACRCRGRITSVEENCDTRIQPRGK